MLLNKLQNLAHSRLTQGLGIQQTAVAVVPGFLINEGPGIGVQVLGVLQESEQRSHDDHRLFVAGVAQGAPERCPAGRAGFGPGAGDPYSRQVLQESHEVPAIPDVHLGQGLAGSFVLQPQQQPGGLAPVGGGGKSGASPGLDPGFHGLGIIAGRQ